MSQFTASRSPFRRLRNPLVIAVALAASVSSTASAVEFAVNGGFELGSFANWTQFPSAPGNQTITTINPASGLFAAEIFNNVPQSNSLFKQANLGIGQIQPGDIIDISFDARGTFPIGGVAFAEFFSELSGGGTSKSEILGGGPLNGGIDMPNWTRFNFSTTAGFNVSGGVTLQLGATNGLATGTRMFYDNISIQPRAAEPKWIGTASGDYFTASNWLGGLIPNGNGAAANFTTPVASGTRTVFADSSYTLSTLRFASANTYQLVGTGLTLTSATTALIDVVSGAHKINLPTTFASSTSIVTAAGSTLLISNPVTLSPGVIVTKNGAGTLTFQSTISASAPATIKLNMGGSVNFDAGNNSPNLSVIVDPATVNFGSNQTLAALTLALGGNTVNVGRTSSGTELPATVSTSSVNVSGGAGGTDTLNTALPSNALATVSLTVSTGATLNKQGAGNLSAMSTALSGTLLNNAGTSSLGSVTGTGTLRVNVGSVSAARVRVGTLAVAANATATLTSSGGVSAINFLDLPAGGTVDLTSGALVVRNGDLAALSSYVAAWLNSPSQSGPGLKSSLSVTDGFTTLAVVPNALPSGANYFDAYADLSLNAADVLIRYTYKGDTNLDGTLDGNDLVNLIEGLSNGLTGWRNGDTNYDGVVDVADYNIFSLALAANLPSLGAGPSSGSAGSGGTVPEPTALALLAPAATLLARRRRA